MNKTIIRLGGLMILTLALTGCGSHGEDYTAQFMAHNYDGTYEGEMVNDKPEGQGTFTCDNPERYDSLTYTGGWKDGLANGTGTFELTFEDGSVETYTGEFKNGLQDGHGKTIPHDGTHILEGTYTAGLYNPSFLELVTALGTVKDNMDYVLTDEQVAFLTEHESDFLNHPKNLSASAFDLPGYVDDSANFKPHFVKMDQLRNLRHVQLPAWEGTMVNYMLSLDAQDRGVTIMYFGEMDQMHDDAHYNMVGLPLSVCYYPTEDGKKVPTILIFAASIEP